MTSKECEQQLKELVEVWDLNEATLNQTDINAIKHLLLENQQLFDVIKKKGIVKTCDNCDCFGACPHSYKEYDYMMTLGTIKEYCIDLLKEWKNIESNKDDHVTIIVNNILKLMDKFVEEKDARP